MTAIPLEHDWVGETWDWPLQHNDGVVRVTNNTDKFEVGLDVQFFTPNEIEVKVSGQDILINCRHEVRNDVHGTVTREIHRAYKLPSDVDVSTLKSHLSSRGVLNISAQKKK
uniref:SHSP domain-containing protein n=1 Tax=Panagrolaimus sp. ES5 TaxID=591445 RepID=A0AC34G411_9BILA